MPPDKSRYIDVDNLLLHVSLEQAAAFYGVELPELKRVGSSIRTRCFLMCGKPAETGERALSVQADDPAKAWRCFQTSCGKSGNLVGLCDLMKPGDNSGGKPRGDRFKAIAADLAAMHAGMIRAVDLPETTSATVDPPKPTPANVSLAESPNEKARALVHLDAKFVRDPAALPPAVSKFFRTRPHLTPEVLADWRIGYLPRDTGADKSGGTMRGKVVFPMHSDSGELLTWFGLDPEHEQKLAAWESGGKKDAAPERYHFVKGFHYGLEVFGQERLKSHPQRDVLKAFGLPVVSDPTQVLKLATLGLPAVASCRAGVTREQAAKIGRLVQEHADGKATVWADCTEAGEAAMKAMLGYLSQECFVRVAWTTKSHAGTFAGKTIDDVSAEQVNRLFPTSED